VSAITKRDAIDAAMSVAEDVAESRLDPAALDQAVADECKALFGTVVGPGDSLWPLHVDVARHALALGALTADELSEWLAVARSRAGEPIGSPQPPSGFLPSEPSASDATSPDSDQPDDADEIELSDDGVREPDAEPDRESAQTAPTAGADCGDTESAMVDLPDGRRIPRRHIIARGRGLPTDDGLRPF
jgi:hypothetical protein